MDLKSVEDGTILFSLIALLPVRFDTHTMCVHSTQIYGSVYIAFLVLSSVQY